MASIRAEDPVITVPSLSQDAAEQFISRLVPKNFAFDDGGSEIPDLDSSVLDVLYRLSDDANERIFNTKAFDPEINLEDLEFLGEAALRCTVSALIEEREADLARGWRNTLRTRLISRPCMSRIALGLRLDQRVRLVQGGHLSQAVLEDVLEAIAGAIFKELGYEELYAWTVRTFGPMIPSYKDVLLGKFGLGIYLARSAADMCGCLLIRTTEQARKADKNPYKQDRTREAPTERSPESSSKIGFPTVKRDVSSRVTGKSRQPVLEATETGPTSAPGVSREDHEALKLAGLTKLRMARPIKRARVEQAQEANGGLQLSAPISQSSGRSDQVDPPRSKADVHKFCMDKGYSLAWKSLGFSKVDGQHFWTEELTVAGKYRVSGTSSGKKKAQAAACEALIRSGVLTDFPEYQQERRKRRRLDQLLGEHHIIERALLRQRIWTQVWNNKS